MEINIPKEMLKMRAYKHMADIMRNTRQRREEQSQGEQVQKELTQKEITAIERLDIYFKAVTLAKTNTEKVEIAKKVFNVYRRNRNNNDITSVCLFIFANISESMDLTIDGIGDIIKEVIGIGMDIIYNSEIEHHNNPEYIDDFKMYITPIIYALALRINSSGQLFFMILDYEKLKKSAETIYNIYLHSPKEEYNEAIISCMKMFSIIAEVIHTNKELQEDVFKKICTIYDIVIGTGNNIIAVECLQLLSAKATGCYTHKDVRKKAFEKICDICDKAFEKVDNISIKECLQSLSEIVMCTKEVREKALEKISTIYDYAIETGNYTIAIEYLKSLSKIGQYTPDQTIRKKALEKISTIYDYAIETGNYTIAIEYLKSLSEIAIGSHCRKRVQTEALEKICTIYDYTIETGNYTIAVECLQSLSKIATARYYAYPKVRAAAFEKLYTICDNAIKEGNDVIAMKCLQPLSEIKNRTRNQIIRGRASEMMDTVYSSDLKKDIEYSQVDLIRLTQANENMSATVGLDVQYSKSNG